MAETPAERGRADAAAGNPGPYFDPEWSDEEWREAAQAFREERRRHEPPRVPLPFAVAALKAALDVWAADRAEARRRDPRAWALAAAWAWAAQRAERRLQEGAARRLGYTSAADVPHLPTFAAIAPTGGPPVVWLAGPPPLVGLSFGATAVAAIARGRAARRRGERYRPPWTAELASRLARELLTRRAWRAARRAHSTRLRNAPT